MFQADERQWCHVPGQLCAFCLEKPISVPSPWPGWVMALSLRAGEEGGDEAVWGASVLHPAPDSQEEMGWEIQGFMADPHP